MQISDRGLNLIESFEGFSSYPYWDSYGRVYTRGFGETEGISALSPPISRRQGEENLRTLVNDIYGKAVNDLRVPLNQNQFDALCSFVYNLGTGALEWNIGRSLREGRYNQAANEMLEYNRAGGVVLPGLTRRREEERRLFLTPVKPIPAPNPLDVFYPNERRVVNSYLAYSKHPKLHPHGIKVTKEQMILFRKNIFEAAEHGHLYRSNKRVKSGWNI